MVKNRRMRKVRTSRVLQRFSDWVVTTYGLECTSWYYPIEKSRLWEGDNQNYPWTRHMGEKKWMNLYNFHRAFHAARQIHGAERLK